MGGRARLPLLCPPLLRHTSHSHRGDAFFSADEAHALVGGGFDADLIGLDAKGSRELFFHQRSMLHHARCFGDEGGVHVFNRVTFLRSERGALFQNAEAADAFDAHVARRKVVADVWQAHGSEYGIGDGVAEHVGIGMAFETASVGDLYTAEDEWAAFFKGVNVVSDACACHAAM
jgi:hypothetical protein